MRVHVPAHTPRSLCSCTMRGMQELVAAPPAPLRPACAATATHGPPRMTVVPSRCPCPSHPAVNRLSHRPDPAEPVQLCSCNTAARIALETPEPVSTRPLRALRRRHRPRHRPRSGSTSICTEDDGWDVRARLLLFQTVRRVTTKRHFKPCEET